MKLSLSAPLFAALWSSSDASFKQDKHLRAPTEKFATPPETPFQKAPKGAEDVESFLVNRHAMEEQVSYSMAVTVGSTERVKQRANNEKQHALAEKKTKGLPSTENDAGAYVVTPKLGNKKSDEATLTHNEVETRTDDCTVLTLEIGTDSWPEETFVALLSAGGDRIWEFGDFEPNTAYAFTACIPNDACTVLDITDTLGDGLLGDGYLTVTWGADVVHDDWNIGYGFFMYLGDAC